MNLGTLAVYEHDVVSFHMKTVVPVLRFTHFRQRANSGRVYNFTFIVILTCEPHVCTYTL